MGRNNDRDRGRRATKENRPTRGKPKICIFCAGKGEWVDYKDINVLRRFTSDRGKIRARRVSGNCAQHQRDVAVAIKTAREVALLPYTVRVTSSCGGGRDRGDRGDRGGRGERERDLELDTSPVTPRESAVAVLDAEPLVDVETEAADLELDLGEGDE